MSTGLLPITPTQPGGDPDLLKAELLHVITTRIDAAPRSQQTRIGPSEIGTPCDRRLGYKLRGTPESNPFASRWKATIGTGVHAWLEAAFDADNATADRWLLEHQVSVGEIDGVDITGHCDLYDLVTGSVVDWKTTSVNKIKAYRRDGPGEQYRVQAHLYGRGWTRKGYQVHTVAVVFLPRDGELSQAWMWSEPYNETVATAALARANAVAMLNRALGDNTPAVLNTADAYCRFCPFYSPGSTNLTKGCPGHPSVAQQTDRTFDGLIPEPVATTGKDIA